MDEYKGVTFRSLSGAEAVECVRHSLPQDVSPVLVDASCRLCGSVRRRRCLQLQPSFLLQASSKSSPAWISSSVHRHESRCFQRGAIPAGSQGRTISLVVYYNGDYHRRVCAAPGETIWRGWCFCRILDVLLSKPHRRHEDLPSKTTRVACRGMKARS